MVHFLQRTPENEQVYRVLAIPNQLVYEWNARARKREKWSDIIVQRPWSPARLCPEYLFRRDPDRIKPGCNRAYENGIHFSRRVFGGARAVLLWMWRAPRPLHFIGSLQSFPRAFHFQRYHWVLLNEARASRASSIPLYTNDEGLFHCQYNCVQGGQGER